MKLFGQIIRTVVNTAMLPVAAAKDVLTLGGTVTKGKLESYTAEQIEKLKEEAGEDDKAADPDCVITDLRRQLERLDALQVECAVEASEWKKRAEAAEAEWDAAVSTLRVLNEETVLAGYPGGDRDQTLANVRQMRAKLAALPSEEEIAKALCKHHRGGDTWKVFLSDAKIVLALLKEER